MCYRYCTSWISRDRLQGSLNAPFRYDLRRISKGNTPTTQAPIDQLGRNR